MEQRCYGVRTVLVEPGAFATAIWRKFTPPEDLDLARLEPILRPVGARARANVEPPAPLPTMTTS
jgi:hypothetical protein